MKKFVALVCAAVMMVSSVSVFGAGSIGKEVDLADDEVNQDVTTAATAADIGLTGDALDIVNKVNKGEFVSFPQAARTLGVEIPEGFENASFASHFMILQGSGTKEVALQSDTLKGEKDLDDFALICITKDGASFPEMTDFKSETGEFKVTLPLPCAVALLRK